MDDTRYTLIRRLRDQHNEDAWAVFTSTYEGYILAVLIRAGASHDEAIDLRQEILLKLWKRLPDFDFNPEIAKFRTWLCQVVHNTAYTYFSSVGAERKRVKRYFEDNPPDAEPAEGGFQDLLDQEWKSHLSKLALENIKQTISSQSLSIFQRMLKGANASDLAKEYGLKENTIHRIKNRTRDKLIIEVARLREDLE